MHLPMPHNPLESHSFFLSEHDHAPPVTDILVYRLLSSSIAPLDYLALVTPIQAVHRTHGVHKLPYWFSCHTRSVVYLARLLVSE